MSAEHRAVAETLISTCDRRVIVIGEQAAGEQPASRDAGAGTRTFSDGTVVRGPDQTLYTYVAGELLEIDDVPRAASDDEFLAIFGAIPPQLSPADLEKTSVGSMPRGVVEISTPRVEVYSDMPRRYMQTDARLSQDACRLDATTRISTEQPWFGFTGGVIVLFAGANGECLDASDVFQVGVDGFRVPFKQSRREVTWSRAVDAAVCRATVSLAVHHSHAPRNRINEIVAEAISLAKSVAQVIQTLSTLR